VAQVSHQKSFYVLQLLVFEISVHAWIKRVRFVEARDGIKKFRLFL